MEPGEEPHDEKIPAGPFREPESNALNPPPVAGPWMEWVPRRRWRRRAGECGEVAVRSLAFMSVGWGHVSGPEESGVGESSGVTTR